MYTLFSVWVLICLGEENGEKGYAHAPVCLQLVGARWEDENVLEALARIEKAMRS